MKARCPHGAPWFADCPWCRDTDTAYRPPRQVVLTIPFWRNMTEADARAHLESVVDELEERFKIISFIRAQMRRAMWNSECHAFCRPADGFHHIFCRTK